MTKKFIFKLLESEITTKYLKQKILEEVIDFQKLSSVQSQSSLEEALENNELKNFLNQMNRELAVPESRPDPDPRPKFLSRL